MANISENDYSYYNELTDVAHIVYRIWSVSFLVIGIPTNLISFFIFQQWSKKFSIYCYLSLLCLINVLILIIDLPFHCLIPYYMDSTYLIEKLLPHLCRFGLFFTYVFRYIFVWLLVFINIDRVLFLKESKLKGLFCKMKTAVINCVIIVIISCILNLHFLLYYNQPIIIKIPSILLCSTDGRLCDCRTINKSYQFFWEQVWPIYNGLIFGIIPFLIMTICCIIIIMKLYKTRDELFFDEDKKKDRPPSGESIVSTGYSSHKKRQTDQIQSITLTLIVLDMLFPLTIFPTLFFQIYLNYNPPLTCRTIGQTNILIAFGFACTFIKNTFGFFIYLVTGSKFRKTIKKLIMKIFCNN